MTKFILIIPGLARSATTFWEAKLSEKYRLRKYRFERNDLFDGGNYPGVIFKGAKSNYGNYVLKAPATIRSRSRWETLVKFSNEQYEIHNNKVLVLVCYRNALPHLESIFCHGSVLGRYYESFDTVIRRDLSSNSSRVLLNQIEHQSFLRFLDDKKIEWIGVNTDSGEVVSSKNARDQFANVLNYIRDEIDSKSQRRNTGGFVARFPRVSNFIFKTRLPKLVKKLILKSFRRPIKSMDLALTPRTELLLEAYLNKETKIQE